MTSAVMASLSWAGLGLFCVVSLIVGVRLIRLYWRTKEPPELLGSLALLGIGPLGFAPAVFSPQLVGTSPGVADGTWAAAFICINLGTVTAYMFTQQVFRPGQASSIGIVVVVSFLLSGCWLTELATTGFAADRPAGPAVRVSDLVRTLGLLWGAGESLRYYRMMRKREQLGLGDPVVMHRMLWWGIGIGSAGAVGVINVAMRVAEAHAYEMAWLTLLTSAGGTAAAFGLLRAFAPRSAVPAAGQAPAT